MNHFLALRLSEKERQEVWQLSWEWQRRFGAWHKAKWYTPEDYHVTLKFLGSIQGNRQPDIIHAAEAVLKDTASFRIRLASPGAFPNIRRPDVLWIGIEENAQLNALAKRLNKAAAEIGFPFESRSYQPHITVARCRPSHGVGLGDWPLPKEHMFLMQDVNHFYLMQTLPQESRANGAKARYNIVHTFPLSGTEI